MKVAIISLLPDSGHVIPLFKIARILSQQGAEIKYFGPTETQKNAADYGINSVYLGEIKPSNHQAALTKLSRSGPILKEAIFSKWFYINYIEKVIYNGLLRAELLKNHLANFSPDIILTDNRLFSATYKKIAIELDVPIILNEAAGNLYNFQPEGFPLNPDFGAIGKIAFSIFKKTLAKSYLAVKKIIFPSEFKWDEEVHQYIAAHWNQCTRENVDSAKSLNLLYGLACLEKKYIANKIYIPRNLVQLGPLPITIQGELSANLQEWLKLKPETPIVYVCFGSMIKEHFSFSKKIITAAQSLGYRVLWVNGLNPLSEEKTSCCDFYWEAWASQTQLLSNQNIKIFITHAGSGASQEALWFAKPSICIPFVADQFYNAWVVEQLGCGLAIDRNKITLDSILKSMIDVLTCEETTKKISQEFKSLDSSKETYNLIADFAKKL